MAMTATERSRRWLTNPDNRMNRAVARRERYALDDKYREAVLKSARQYRRRQREVEVVQ